MKKITAIITLLLMGISVTAQNVKIKKKVVYVDGVAELNYKGCQIHTEGNTCLVYSEKSGKPLFSLHLVYHDGHYNVNVSFIDFEENLRVKVISYKKLFEQMYSLKVVDENGVVNEENARKYSRTFNTIKPRKVIITE